MKTPNEVRYIEIRLAAESPEIFGHPAGQLVGNLGETQWISTEDEYFLESEGLSNDEKTILTYGIVNTLHRLKEETGSKGLVKKLRIEVK